MDTLQYEEVSIGETHIQQCNKWTEIAREILCFSGDIKEHRRYAAHLRSSPVQQIDVGTVVLVKRVEE